MRLTSALSATFLVLVRALSPLRHTIFLLQRIFSCSCDAIKHMIGRGPICYQRLTRQTQRCLDSGQPHFRISPRQRRRLIRRFLQTYRRNSLRNLIKLLTRSVAFYSSNNNGIPTTLGPICKTVGITHLVLGIHQRGPPSAQSCPIRVGKRTNILRFISSRLSYICAFSFTDSCLRTVCARNGPSGLALLGRGLKSRLRLSSGACNRGFISLHCRILYR